MFFKAKKYSLPLGEKNYIMAVINLTPDSFYEGSRFDLSTAVKAAEACVRQGADIIDLGAQSTAPDSKPITAQQELKRLLEPLREIRRVLDVPISVDTFFPEVAKAALENGADIINDVSGTADTAFAKLAKEHSAGWIAMHTGGLKSSEESTYPNGVINDINLFFDKAVKTAESVGLSHEQLCLDPGIGFGKSREDDLEIISGFEKLETLGCASLAALSRKRVTRLCGDALTGTVICNAMCILGGADIIRVHDTEAALATIKMAQLLKGGNNCVG